MGSGFSMDIQVETKQIRTASYHGASHGPAVADIDGSLNPKKCPKPLHAINPCWSTRSFTDGAGDLKAWDEASNVKECQEEALLPTGLSCFNRACYPVLRSADGFQCSE